MALAALHIISATNEVDGSSFVTASAPLVANRVAFLAVDNRIASGVAGGTKIPTVTGCGLSWQLIGTVNGAGATPNRRATVFRAMGTPTAGALTIDLAGETQTHCHHALVQIQASVGAAITSNVVGVNDGGTPSTTFLATLPAFQSAQNLAVGFVVVTSGLTITPGSGFAQIATYTESSDGTTGLVETKTNDPTVDATWAGANSWFGIAMELQDAVRVDGDDDGDSFQIGQEP